jgi:hypothetical protein
MVFKAEIHGFYKCFFAKGKWNHFSLGQQKWNNLHWSQIQILQFWYLRYWFLNNKRNEKYIYIYIYIAIYGFGSKI